MITKRKMKKIQLSRDKEIISRLIPPQARVAFVNGYLPEHPEILGMIGIINGFRANYQGRPVLCVRFTTKDWTIEEHVPIDKILDHIKICRV